MKRDARLTHEFGWVLILSGIMISMPAWAMNSTDKAFVTRGNASASHSLTNNLAQRDPEISQLEQAIDASCRALLNARSSVPCASPAGLVSEICSGKDDNIHSSVDSILCRVQAQSVNYADELECLRSELAEVSKNVELLKLKKRAVAEAFESQMKDFPKAIDKLLAGVRTEFETTIELKQKHNEHQKRVTDRLMRSLRQGSELQEQELQQVLSEIGFADRLTLEAGEEFQLGVCEYAFQQRRLRESATGGSTENRQLTEIMGNSQTKPLLPSRPL